VALKLLGENALAWLNPYNFRTLDLIRPNFKHQSGNALRIHAESFVEIEQGKRSCRALIFQNFVKFSVLGAYAPTYAPILVHGWGPSVHSSMPNFAKIGATSHPYEAKNFILVP